MTLPLFLVLGVHLQPHFVLKNDRSASPRPQEKKKRVRAIKEFQPELGLELHLMVT